MPHYRLEEDSPQHRFHISRHKLQIMGGGFGNGKTTALVIKALKLARDYPGSNGLLGRATYPKLKDTLQKVFFEWCPPHWIKKRPTQDDNTCYLLNGTAVNFRYVAQKGKQSETGETTSNLLSATYDWIGIDQAEDPEITEKDVLDLFGRLRGQTPYRPEQGQDDETMPDSGPRWLMLTLNPTRNWIYRDIIQPYHLFKKRGIFSDKLLIDEETRLPIIDLVEGSTYTNAANLPPDYLRGLEATYKGQMRDRYLLGKWAAYEGLIYDVFDGEKHMVERQALEAYMHDCLERDVKIEIVEMYDFGLTKPTCYLLGFIDDYGRMIVLDGFYEPNFNYTKHHAAIVKIREKYPFNYTAPIIADPDIFRKKVIAGRRDGETIANLLQPLRFRAGQNAIAPGIAKVHAYLSGRDDIAHIVTGETPSPMIYFAGDLTFIEDEMTSWFWKKNPQGKIEDTPMDGEDHALDCIKYGLSFRPTPAEIVIPSAKLPPKWMFWHEEVEAM